MKRIETWNGKEWKFTPIEKLPIGQVVIRVTEVEVPFLDLDILTPLRKMLRPKGLTLAKGSRTRET